MRATTEFHAGDCRAVLRAMPAGSVHVCMTSPPYLGLRKYPLEPLIWGGVSSCDHRWGKEIIAKQSGGGLAKGGNKTGGDKNWDLGERSQGQFCDLCRAWRGCLGLEPTVGLFVDHIVEVFDEVKRVLRPDGLLFLNLGDSMVKKREPELHLQSGDLAGVPWRVAFALQERGWRLKNDVIWHQRNATPESALSRFSITHEYVFVFSRGPKHFFDVDAVRCENGARRRTVWTINKKAFPGLHFATFPGELVELCVLAGTSERGCCLTCGAQYRRVTEKGDPNREYQWSCGADKDGNYHGQNQKDYTAAGAQKPSDVKRSILKGMREVRTLGWQKMCDCPRAPVVPAVVLDPFGGAGTTNLVAKQLGRSSLYIDQSEEYLEKAKERCGYEAERIETLEMA